MCVRYYEVKPYPRAALNYAIWRVMSDGRIETPEQMRRGSEEFASLDPQGAELVEAFARRAWAFICEQVSLCAGGAAEPSVRRRIKEEVPCLDGWTRQTLWGAAYRYVMT